MRHLLLSLVLLPLLSNIIAAKPNVLLLVADDLGYGDVGVYGCKDIPTPNLDALAAGGVRFTDGYVSAPVCSPCRAGFMTGRYQTRFGHELNTPGADKSEFGLPVTEKTMADRFRAAGYVTGHVGKWHLGNPKMDCFTPMSRGFADSIWYPGQRKLAPLTKHRNGKPEKDDLYVNDAMARDAVAFIQKHKGEPWLLYVPFLAVHEPLDVTEEMEKPFAGVADRKRRKLAALMASMDKAIGTVLAGLRDAGLEQNTLVVFFSDNGSYPKSTGSNGPLRGSKGTTFEGGIRVPFIIQWKGMLPAGAVYRQPVIALDVLPTALAAAGIPAPPDWKLDGVNLLPYLKGENAAAPHATLYWRYGEQWAIRRGDWKLVLAKDVSNAPAPAAPALHNLVQDIGEKTDLSAQHPEKVKELQSLWQQWNAGNVKPLWTTSGANE